MEHVNCHRRSSTRLARAQLERSSTQILICMRERLPIVWWILDRIVERAKCLDQEVCFKIAHLIILRTLSSMFLKVSMRTQETRTETRIFRRLAQLKALSRQPARLGVPAQVLFRLQRLELTQPTVTKAHRQVTSQARQLAVIPIPDPTLVRQAFHPMIFTQSKTNTQQHIHQTTTDTLKPPVTRLKSLPSLPLKLNNIPFKTIALNKMNPSLKFLIILIPSLLILFQVTFHNFILHIIIILTMITLMMTKIHIFQASMHTTHHTHCTTISTKAHHIHKLIITVREVCMRLVVILIPTSSLDRRATAEIERTAIKSPTTLQIFQ